jgi:hypothetical protein
MADVIECPYCRARVITTDDVCPACRRNVTDPEAAEGSKAKPIEATVAERDEGERRAFANVAPQAEPTCPDVQWVVYGLQSFLQG